MYVINETAELVKCLCCGAEKYSTRKPFICHKCWRTGRAAEHMQQLTKRPPDAACTHEWQASTRQNVTAVCVKCGEESPCR
jgi:hypothetical protein